MTGYLDTEIASAIKLASRNKGKNITSKYRLNAHNTFDNTSTTNYLQAVYIMVAY